MEKTNRVPSIALIASSMILSRLGARSLIMRLEDKKFLFRPEPGARPESGCTPS